VVAVVIVGDAIFVVFVDFVEFRQCIELVLRDSFAEANVPIPGDPAVTAIVEKDFGIERSLLEKKEGRREVEIEVGSTSIDETVVEGNGSIFIDRLDSKKEALEMLNSEKDDAELPL
jgi:hypothetical protein